MVQAFTEGPLVACNWRGMTGVRGRGQIGYHFGPPKDQKCLMVRLIDSILNQEIKAQGLWL